jgi:hypothetical protein
VVSANASCNDEISEWRYTYFRNPITEIDIPEKETRKVDDNYNYEKGKKGNKEQIVNTTHREKHGFRGN